MAVDVVRTIYLDAISVIASQFHISKVISDFQPIMDILESAPKEIIITKVLEELKSQQTRQA